MLTPELQVIHLTIPKLIPQELFCNRLIGAEFFGSVVDEFSLCVHTLTQPLPEGEGF